jgi:hypothetical protein
MQLLWTLTTQYYGTGLDVKSQASTVIECVLFFVSIIIMLKTRDMAELLQPKSSNLILIIPTFTVLLPILLGFPLEVPSLLVLPHLVYAFIFSASITIILLRIFKGHIPR